MRMLDMAQPGYSGAEEHHHGAGMTTFLEDYDAALGTAKDMAGLRGISRTWREKPGYPENFTLAQEMERGHADRVLRADRVTLEKVVEAAKGVKDAVPVDQLDIPTEVTPRQLADVGTIDDATIRTLFGDEVADQVAAERAKSPAVVVDPVVADPVVP